MQTNKSIFSKNIFNIPLNRNGEDVHVFLKNIYKEYIKTIKSFDGEVKETLKPNLPIIEKECNSILKSIELYQNGVPSKAFLELEKCLNELNMLGLLEIQQGNFNSGRNELYKVRISESSNLSKDEIFHIPFQLREKVATQRFSIPGLPCIYLADSIYICWEELDRPDFESMHVSRFDITNANYKLLYLNNNSDLMRKRCFNSSNTGIKINQFVKYLSYWPLLAACSLKVFKKNDVFKPEYLIPQLILQWVVSVQNLDGIQYKSNRVKFNNHNIGTFSNIAIPVKKSTDKGFCPELLKKIKITNPISWQLLDISDPNKDFLNKVKTDIKVETLRKASYIEMVENEKTEYLKSKFGIMEEKLRSMRVSLINK